MSRKTYKFLLLAIATVFLAWQFVTTSVLAADSTAEMRTVPLNDKEKIILSNKDLATGKKLFQNACATCHVGGATFTNPNVGLDPESLALATPPRDNIEALVAFMKNPTTFDGVDEIYETHPSMRSTDLFPTMRGLTDKDLKLIAGHILYQPKVRGIGWGGGKIYY
jgi:photosystem II cytochrome c550